jgi:hypothetical protein
MRQKAFYRTLFYTGLLFLYACDFPGAPPDGQSCLTINLSGANLSLPGHPSSLARSVLSDSETSNLAYKLNFTGVGGAVIERDVKGGSISVALSAGEWTIAAEAYSSGDGLLTLVGTGTKTVAVVPGKHQSVTIQMYIDPAYEASLEHIYIHNEAELRRIGTDFAIDDSHRFYLERDIVLAQPWKPVGNGGDPFKAVFDGQGHSITVNSFDGAVKEPGDNFVYLGFFAAVEEAEIKNLKVNYGLGGAVDIRTGDGSTYYSSYAGGIAGRASNTSFESIQVSGNFSAISDADSNLGIGGIAGEGNGVTITDCHVSGVIGGTSVNYLTIGGIAGSSSTGAVISGSFFTGTIAGNAPSGNAEAGGIAGYLLDTEITACFAEGHIKAEADSSNAGGIAGNTQSSSGSSINKSYAAGVIESVASGAYSNAGGITGKSEGTIENCYAWADVSSSSTYGETAGGIAGTNSGTISKCYAAGTVQSKGHDPYTVIGGITGDGSGVSGCMALVSNLDGGPSSSTSKTAHAIFASTYGTGTGNYSRNDIIINNETNSADPGINAKDGEQKPLDDFKTPTLYTTAGWNVTGDWKFISGYDYPVLSWQNGPPDHLPPPV